MTFTKPVKRQINKTLLITLGVNFLSIVCFSLSIQSEGASIGIFVGYFCLLPIWLGSFGIVWKVFLHGRRSRVPKCVLWISLVGLVCSFFVSSAQLEHNPYGYGDVKMWWGNTLSPHSVVSRSLTIVSPVTGTIWALSIISVIIIILVSSFSVESVKK